MSLKAKTIRHRDDTATTASKMHKLIGALLSQGVFSKMIVYQEYPVSEINPACKNGRLKVDWYIKTLNVAIEIQGEHHYDAVQYGGISEENAKNEFVKQVHKDQTKAYYCEEVGCPVIEIHFKDKPNESWLLERIQYACKQILSLPKKHNVHTKSVKTEYEKQLAEKRRAYNRERYRRGRERRRV